MSHRIKMIIGRINQDRPCVMRCFPIVDVESKRYILRYLSLIEFIIKMFSK